MKFNYLTCAVWVATATMLVSCDDDKKPAANTPPATTQEQQISAPALADLVENRYKNAVQLDDKVYSIMNFSPLLTLQTAINSYQKTDSGAEAKTTTTFVPKDSFRLANKPLTLTTDDTIQYNPELFKQGIVARIEQKKDFSMLLNQLADFEEAKSFFESIFKHATYQIDLLTDARVQKTIQVVPYKTAFCHDDCQLDFGGFNLTVHYKDQAAGQNIIANQWSTVLKPFVFTSHNDVAKFSQIAGQGEWTADGNASLTVQPIKVELIDHTSESTKTIELTLDGIEQKSTGIVFDQELDDFLGETTAKTGDIIFTRDGETTNFGYLTYNSKTDKTEKNNYDLSGGYAIHFAGENLKQSFNLPILLHKFSAAAKASNLSPEAIDIVSKIGQVEQIENKEEQEKALFNALNAFMNNLSLNKTQISSNFALETAEGKANIDLTFSPRAGEIDGANWQKAIAHVQDDPFLLLELLQKKCDFTIDIAVSHSLLSAFGVAELVEMQGQEMINNQDGILSVKIENSPEGLKINGKQMF